MAAFSKSQKCARHRFIVQVHNLKEFQNQHKGHMWHGWWPRMISRIVKVSPKTRLDAFGSTLGSVQDSPIRHDHRIHEIWFEILQLLHFYQPLEMIKMCDVQLTRQRPGVEQTPTASSTPPLAYGDKNIQSITMSQSFWCHKMVHWKDFEYIKANHKIHPSCVFIGIIIAKAETLQEKLKVRTSTSNLEGHP